MKTLIQKDLRENLKVAVIGLLIFSLLLLQAYQTCIQMLTNIVAGNWSGQAGVLQPLLSSSLLTETAFFCAIFGAALGWLQTRNEAHRDLWAFLIHRPITRTEIFQGKAIAGLGLYLLGAGLPLAILVAIVQTPGHVAAPFEWEMVLPLVAIFLSGTAFYFAGLLTGLRQARWYVSRSFGLGLAIAVAASVFGLPVWPALVFIVLAIVILATAAWGSYQTGGFYHGQPATGKLSLTLALTAGCGVAMFVGVGLLITLVFNPLTHRSYSYEYSNYQMTRDGTIYKVISRDGEFVAILDLDGQPLLDPKTGQKMERKEFQKRLTYGGSVATSLKDRNQNHNPIQDVSRFFSLWNISDKTLWYLDRHGKLTGYDGRTRKYIGSLDAHSPDGTLASEPFLRHPNSYYYYSSYNDVSRKLLPTARSVYQVDFKERTVKPIFTLTNNDEIGGYADEQGGYDENQVKNFLITTRKTICLMNYEGKIVFTVPYQPAFFEYPSVQLSFLQPTKSATNQFAVWFQPDYGMNQKADWKMPVHIRWLGPEQAVTKSLTLPALHQTSHESWTDQLATALLPLPAHLEFNKNIFSAWNLFSCTLAFISAAIGWSLARRYNFSTKACIGWTLFILLLGVAGLLTFLCVQEWPARETCPHCQKLRSVDRATCEHCASPFSPPEKNGTEIFERLVKV